MLKRKRTKLTDAERDARLRADVKRLDDAVKRLESVNAVATKTIEDYVPRVTSDDLTWIGIPAQNDCHEVRA